MPRNIKKKFDPTKEFSTVGEDLANKSAGTVTATYGGAKNLLAWWKLDTDISTSGDAVDSSGNGYTASPVNDSHRPDFSTSTPSFRIQDHSNYFDGSSSALNISNPSDNAFDFTDGSGNDEPFSVSFWIKPDFIGAEDTHGIFSKGETYVEGTNSYVIYAHEDADTTIRLRFRMFSDADNYVGAYKAEVVTNGVWQHFVCTYDGSNTRGGIKIYKNGEDVGASTFYEDTYVGMPINAYDRHPQARFFNINTFISYTGSLKLF